MTSTHLGDGAYLSWDGQGYIITGNDHDPHKATDVVHLDRMAMAQLRDFVDRIDQGRIFHA